VTGVLTLITGLILASNSRFGGMILLENLTYDVALSIRQAQVYGISVRRFGERNFSLGYGMYFAQSNPYEYVLFGDVSQDGVFDCEQDVGVCERVELTSISRGYHILVLCAPAGATMEECLENKSIQKTRLDVLFQRPEPDAFIRANGDAAIQQSARIVLESPRGDKRSVVVHITGQISAE